MRRYETVVIIDPDLSDEQRDPFYEKLKEVISHKDGFLIEFDEWGTQKLAYEIRKKKRGHYVRLDYCGDGAHVSELERSLKIDDRCLKFMTILLEKKADVEQIQREMAKKEADKESSDAEEHPPTDETPTDETPTDETPTDETPPEEETENSTADDSETEKDADADKEAAEDEEDSETESEPEAEADDEETVTEKPLEDEEEKK